jgi:hypothetical protein
LKENFMHKYFMVILLLFGGVKWVEGIEGRETGVGFQIAPIGFCLSGRFWPGNMGYCMLGGVWVDEGEKKIKLGCGVLYKVKEFKRVNGYLGAEFLYRGEEWLDDGENVIGVQFLVGMEYFPRRFPELGLNIEVGQCLGFVDDFRAGIDFGMGAHYYF